MNTHTSKTSGHGDCSLATIHGFRVQSYGKPLSSGFKRGLGRLAERGFADATCVVAKTTNGSRSGITHAGGRYVAADGLYRTEVIQEMRKLGLEPPPLPFVVAPGEYTLYHEWGHHVDRSWSGDDQNVTFSFCWFSRFYQLCVQPSRITHAVQGLSVDCRDIRPIESEAQAVSAVLLWWHASSELFADLFEDWMRGEKQVGWDHCEPGSLNRREPRGDPSVRIGLLPGVSVDDVRADTYQLFMTGTRPAHEVPTVRPGLFGAFTDETVSRFRHVLGAARTESPRY